MTERLYYPPEHTEDVLREATSGASTVEGLAEGLGIASRTASNKVHDPSVLGLIDRDDNELSVSEDARRVVQLKDTSPLENAFHELPGVSEVLDRIEDDSVEVEEIGRLISFETGSNAAADSTFRNYGRVYGEWIDYLDLGSYSNGVVASGKIDEVAETTDPLENPRGPNNPRVPPEKVFEILPLITRAESREELQQQSDYSDRYTTKDPNNVLWIRGRRVNPEWSRADGPGKRTPAGECRPTKTDPGKGSLRDPSRSSLLRANAGERVPEQGRHEAGFRGLS